LHYATIALYAVLVSLTIRARLNSYYCFYCARPSEAAQEGLNIIG
jgi:hypothetical protein